MVDILIKSDLAFNYRLSSFVLKRSLCVSTTFAGCVGQDTFAVEYIHSCTWVCTYLYFHSLPHMNTQHSTLVNLIYL